MKKIAQFFLWIFGWEIEKNNPKDIKKCVIVVGPHTSNWDFIIGKWAFMFYGLNTRFLIKKEAFFFPMGIFLKRMGGIPVNRKERSNITQTAINIFKDSDEMYMVFTPEGTRSYNPHWKKGFYFIAEKAKVPIYICYLDYKTKKAGFHSLLVPSGNVEDDIKKIKEILKNYSGKIPKNGIY